MGHILVDFDRTLATYESWEKNGSALGSPVPAMVERINRWLAQGIEVRIFTARASKNNPRRDADLLQLRDWTSKVFGCSLVVTNEKDFETLAIWDDLSVSVEPNTGWRMGEGGHVKDPLTYDEELRLSGWDRKMGSLVE